MKTNNKTTKAIRAMGAGPLKVLMAAALLLSGCAGGGNASNAGSTATWPSATPPATSQTNTYVGTQSPGWYSITIDHTSNTFSYQDLSAKTAAISGTFTTTANGFLALSSGGYVLEMLSRAALLVPTPQADVPVPLTANAVFAVEAPFCQTIPSKTKFEYLGSPNPYYAGSGSGSQGTLVGSGTTYASTDTAGANVTFGGELQYVLPNPYMSSIAGISGVTITPSPDPFSATCATSAGSAVTQTAITVPNSLPANFAIGPTGFFVEDRYQSDKVAFVGSVMPSSPVDVSQLSGATFQGVTAPGGVATAGTPSLGTPQLISVSASLDSSGKSIKLVGGVFPSNDPTQAPGTGINIDLGAQDTNNNGYFPSATYTNTGPNSAGQVDAAYALVSEAGGKYTIFILSGTGAGIASGWILFQQ